MSSIPLSDDAARTAAATQTAGAVLGAPRLILGLEAAAVLVLSVAAYSQVGGGWWLFAALILVPDVSMLGYLAGPRLGAALYNLCHSYVVPAALGAYGLVAGQPLALSVGLIWTAHIGFDRLIGYGLKYSSAFGHTHLSLRVQRG